MATHSESDQHQPPRLTEDDSTAPEAGPPQLPPAPFERSDRDMDALLDAIAHPPPPNDAMLRAIARWRKHFRQAATESG